MSIKHFFFVLFLSAFLGNLLFAQTKNAEKYEAAYALFDTTKNEILFPEGDASFTPLFEKLDTLVFQGKGKVRILHVGGSHIQADVISGRIRENFITKYPSSDAGRGFVFPYSVAKTNTPSTYSAKYKGVWDMSKNVQREISKPLGLLGIAASTRDPRAEFTIALNAYNQNTPIWFYNKVRLFGYADSNDVFPALVVDSALIFGVHDSLSQSFVFELPKRTDTLQVVLHWKDSLLQDSLKMFIQDSIRQDSLSSDSLLAADLNAIAKDTISKDTLKRDSSESKKYPYFTLSGILLENDNSGISYTSVGINGAKVPNYFERNCPLLEQELSFFKPDLVIFGIGINDANVEIFNPETFIANYDTLITRIKKINPEVAIIFTTNNDSYRKQKRRYLKHPNGELAKDAFFKLAEKYKAGIFDMFSLMGGLGSMSHWEKAGLAKKDKVHFTHAGYVFLGDMFYEAFLKAYYNHIAKLPAERSAKETENSKN